MAAVGTTFDSGSVLGDRFVLSSRLGTGASARVFLATDLRRQCPVAVKVLHESLASDARFVQQFERESRLVASLHHDHIVTVIDAGTVDVDDMAVPFIVTEYYAGGSLASLLDSGALLDAAQVASVGAQAAGALAHAHRQGLVHRDVKPSNLLFDAAGRLALADFGIARAIASASATEPTGAGAGATRYASPEQVMGRSAEPRTDVYSLALVLVEAATGTVPLLGDSPVATMGRRVREDVEIPDALAPLRAALIAATDREPDKRCDAADLGEALEAAASELPAPEPLPLAPVISTGDDTAELLVDRSGGSVRILGAAPLGSSGEGSGHGSGEGPGHGSGEGPGHEVGAGSGVGPVDGASGADQIDLRSSEQSSHGSVSGAGVSAGGAGSGDSESDEFGRDSIAVAEEYRALDSARPVSLGVVDPLDAAPVGATIDPDKGVGSRRGRRRRWFAAVAVLLLLALSGGADWWFFVRVPTHTVPDWVGSQLEEATSQAESNGWVVGDPERVRRDGTTTGQVLAQNPSPGTDLSEGEPVSFTVSDGPTLTAVPSLAGMPEPEARAQIESAGLALGSRTTTFDEDVPAGSVVAASPAPGSPAPDDEGRVPKQTAIDLVVSDGPAPRVVPEGIVGVTLEEAQAALGAVQLVAEPTEEYSSSIDKGVVIRSDTAPGSELPRGSAVVLVVSAGPEPIVVPDVTGSTGTAAAAELESRGFTVSGIEGSPSGTVLATDPPAGESRLPGAQVRIFTRSG